MNAQSPTVIIIVGPTAVGKTAYAIRLAKHLGVPIISADSRQCYRELGIAVAKPSPTELQEVPHYFINSHSIFDEVNAGVFEKYALEKVVALFKQHHTLVMVGGTGLYIKAFCDGIDAFPTVDNQLRLHLQAQYEEKGLEWLQQQVQMHDPVFWEIAEQKNPQRLLRALEIWHQTGQSITRFRVQELKERPFQIKKIGLNLPRPLLYERINKRVDLMVQQGLVAEAKQLYALKHLNALQTVGYRELFSYFDGLVNLETAIEQVKTNSRHYAKRQLTWFNKDASINWFSPDDAPLDDIL